ncbi:MAG: acyl-CoA dehydrogenase family protein [Candidatus Binataceae bacterium]
MEAGELQLVRDSLRHLLSETPAIGVAEALRSSGWPDLLDEDGEAAVSILFEEQGRLPAASPALDLIVLTALGSPLEDNIAIVYPGLASKTAPAAIVLPGDVVKVEGLALCGIERASRFRIAVTKADGDQAMATVAATAALRRRPISGFDPDLKLTAVAGELELRVLEFEPHKSRWPDAVSAAHRALGHELIGVAERMVQIAVEHVTTRRQFGKPIGTFQAVKHRLADAYIAVTAARTAANLAWRQDDHFASSMFKALAGRAALQAARQCLQVCGGMGFTWEFPLQRYIKRSHMLDALLGSSQWLQSQAGEQIVATRSVPRPGDL